MSNKFITITSRVCYFLYELIIIPIKHLFCNLNDISSMSIIKREDQCLWNIIHIWLPLWIHFAIYCISVSFKNQFYLSRIHDTTIQFCLSICSVLLFSNALNSSVISRFFRNLFAFFYRSAIFCCFGFNSINTVINVNTINDRFLKSVVDYSVEIKKRLGLWNRSRC